MFPLPLKLWMTYMAAAAVAMPLSRAVSVEAFRISVAVGLAGVIAGVCGLTVMVWRD